MTSTVMNGKKLIPTVGFGKVRFGMTIDEVKAALGRPDDEQTSQLGDSRDDLSTELFYDKLALSLSFDKLADFRLVDIMTEDGCQFSLGDDVHIGDSFESVKAAVLKADYGPFEEHDIQDELADEFDEGQLDEDERMEAQGLAEYDLPEVGVNLYFRDGKLDTIQLGPEYDDDDNIVWPERILE